MKPYYDHAGISARRLSQEVLPIVGEWTKANAAASETAAMI